MFERLLEQLGLLPAGAVYAVIGVLAAVENLFPPVPADTAVALGAFLSGAGQVSAWSIFLVTWLANVTGAAMVYLAARTAGRSFFAGRVGQKLLKPEALTRLEQLYARYGSWAIFLSRFVPGVRAVVPPFAGIVGLGVVRTMVPTAVASGIWYGALTWLAATAVQHAGEVVALVGRVNRWILVVVASVTVIVAVWTFVRRARRVRGAPDA